MAAKQRFPWIAVSALVAIVVVSTVAWLQVPADYSQSDPSVVLPTLGLTQMSPERSKELLVEQLAAYDPTPLFLPSPMNNNEPAIPDDARPRASGPFAVLVPALTKSGLLKFPPPVSIPKTPIDGLRFTERPIAPLALGRDDQVGERLSGRLGRLEALTAASGSVVLTLDLPASTGFPGGDWQPMEFMGAVTPSGLLGELVVTSSSGSGEIDDYFRFLLRKNMRIGQRLSEGFYAFRVGP